MTNRRHFLKQSLAGTLGLGSIGLVDAFFNDTLAAITPASNDFKTLVVINLNGGNDSLGMLIPNTQAEYDLYHDPRRNIAFNKSELLPISPAGIPQNSFAVSPRMPELQELFNEGDASFVANVGSLIRPITKAEFLDPERSVPRPVGLGGHNTQAAYWQADHSNRIDTSKEGWGGRLANEFLIDGVLPTNISINTGHTIFSAHQTQDFYNVGLGSLIKLQDFRFGVTSPEIRARRKAITALNQLAASSSDPFTKHAGTLFQEGIDLNLTLQAPLSDIPDLSDRFPEPKAGNGGAFASRMARAAEMVLIRQQLGMRRQIIFLESAGFDTHSKHAENHGNLMDDLSAYLKAFNQIMKDNGVNDSVLTVTTSEFGRNLASNGDGTDHAWGAQHIVMGGPVAGGQIFGTFPSLELDGPDDYNGLGRMIPTTSISQYGATIARWFGIPDADMASVFPNITNFNGNRYLDFIA